jgi:hypothetical protein
VVSLAVALVPGRRRTACPGVPTDTWNVDHLPSIPSQNKLGGTLRGDGKPRMCAVLSQIKFGSSSDKVQNTTSLGVSQIGGKVIVRTAACSLLFVTQSHSPERHQADSVYFWLGGFHTPQSAAFELPVRLPPTNRRPLTLSICREGARLL